MAQVGDGDQRRDQALAARDPGQAREVARAVRGERGRAASKRRARRANQGN